MHSFIYANLPYMFVDKASCQWVLWECLELAYEVHIIFNHVVVSSNPTDGTTINNVFRTLGAKLSHMQNRWDEGLGVLGNL